MNIRFLFLFLIFFIIKLYSQVLNMDLCISNITAVDLDGDGIDEVIVPTVNGKILAFDKEGKLYVKNGWPVDLKLEVGSPIKAIKDNKGNVYIGVLGMKGGFNILDKNGRVIFKDTVGLNGSILSTGDYNNDGKLEFAFGLPDGGIHFYNANGGKSGFETIDGRVSTNIEAYDWDEDGKLETIFKSDSGRIFIRKNNILNNNLLPENFITGSSNGLFKITDINNDNIPEIVYSVIDKTQYTKILSVDMKNIKTILTLKQKPKSNVIIEDMNNDGIEDVVYIDNTNQIHFYNALNKNSPGYPHYLSNLKGLHSRLYSVDLNNDGKKEIIFTVREKSGDKTISKLIAFDLSSNSILDGYPKIIPDDNGRLLIKDIDSNGKYEIITVYHKIQGFNSEVRLNIIHTNARIPLKFIRLGGKWSF